ncbi:unnamed protein product [Polarella glacialis]|uniref:Lipid-binding serum glycoprotein C-terminal domain-containing protein n=1 Tax=Polarella glacialis TaxID=89957 RepID=A0A813KK42_POLGL|nr:unnamed protein product [Polarella glacialis]
MSSPLTVCKAGKLRPTLLALGGSFADARDSSQAALAADDECVKVGADAECAWSALQYSGRAAHSGSTTAATTATDADTAATASAAGLAGLVGSELPGALLEPQVEPSRVPDHWLLRESVPTSTSQVPGARAWVSQKAIDYLSQCMLPAFFAGLSEMQFHDLDGSYSGVQYNLRNISVVSSRLENSSLSFVENSGLHLCLEGISGEVRMDWHLTSPFGFFKSRGTAEASVKGRGCGLLELGASESGHPTVSLSDLRIKLELGEIHFSKSKLSWFYNSAAFIFKSYLSDVLTTAVSERIQNTILKNLAPRLARMKLAVELPISKANDTFALDLSLLSLQAKSDKLEAQVSGRVHQSSRPDLVYPAAPGTIPDIPEKLINHSMLSLSMTEWIVDSVFWLLYQNGLLAYTVQPDDIPENVFGLKLTMGSMKFLIPGLASAYASDHNMTVTAAVSVPPTLAFSDGFMAIEAPMTFDFNVVLPGSGSAFACALNATVRARSHVWVQPGSPQVLRSNLTIISASSLKQGRSEVGDIDLVFASPLLAIVQPAAEKALNVALKSGAPMVAYAGFSLVNTRIVVADGSLDAFSDFDFDSATASYF